MIQARLRIFAGPNGSGKSTLFDSFSKKYNAGIFLNADLIEKELADKGFIDLSEFNLNLTQKDLNEFLKTERAASLIKKSIEDNHKIDFCIKENVIVDAQNETHSYEGALISAFMRHHLQEEKIDFCFETVMSHPSKIEAPLNFVRLKMLINYRSFLSSFLGTFPAMCCTRALANWRSNLLCQTPAQKDFHSCRG